MKKLVFIIIFLFIFGGLLGNKLIKERKNTGEFDFQFAIEGIKKKHLDAIDIIYILLNRPRFKADINWINFMQKSDNENKSLHLKTSEYLMKTIFTDPYFHEAKMYGGYIYITSVENTSQIKFKDMIDLTSKLLPPESLQMRHLTFLYIMSFGNEAPLSKITEIENEILTPYASIQFFKYFIHLYKKKNMQNDVKRIYRLAINKKNQNDVDEGFKKKALQILSE